MRCNRFTAQVNALAQTIPESTNSPSPRMARSYHCIWRVSVGAMSMISGSRWDCPPTWQSVSMSLRARLRQTSMWNKKTVTACAITVCRVIAILSHQCPNSSIRLYSRRWSALGIEPKDRLVEPAVFASSKIQCGVPSAL